MLLYRMQCNRFNCTTFTLFTKHVCAREYTPQHLVYSSLDEAEPTTVTYNLFPGALVAFILLLAVGLSVLVFPPSAVQRRVGVSLLASAMSLVAAMALANVDLRRGTTVLMVGSLCASFFSCWVIFVMVRSAYVYITPTVLNLQIHTRFAV